MANAREILLNLVGKESVSPAARKAGDALDDLGDDAQGAARKTKRLDNEIEDLNKSLVGLARAYALAGTAEERADIGKSIRKNQSQLRQLMNVKKLMQGAGEDGAEGFVASFVARLGPLMARAPIALNPAVAAIGAPLAAGVATFMGAAMSGAILGGAGIGGIVGGLAIASKHSAVQAQAAAVGKSISSMLQRSAASFVPAAVEGLQIVRGHVLGLEGDLTAIFAKSSTFVAPLARGFGGMARDIVAGIRPLVEQAGPVIDSIVYGMRRFGYAVRDGFESLADNANEGAHALAMFFMIVEAGVRGVFVLVNGLTELYKWMRLVGAAFAHDTASLAVWAAETQRAEESGTGLTASMQEVLKGFLGTDAAATGAAAAVRDFYTAAREGTEINLNAREAQRALEQSIDDATASIKENGRTLDINTQKGRDNAAALDQIQRDAYAAAEAIRSQGGSQQSANAVMERARKAYVEAAVAAGANRKQVEALSRQLFAIPSPNPKVTLDTAKAKAQAKAIQDVVNGIRGKNITIGVWYVTRGRNAGDLKLPGGTSTKDRWGGMHVPMAAGGIMSAGVYRASNPPLIQFAEPATGGEAYIPRKGNAARSGQILSQAAGWYGMDVVPKGAGMRGGGGMVLINNGVIGSKMELENWFTGMYDRLRFQGRVP